MPKTLKKKCCKKYRHKGKACSNCPLMARLGKAEFKVLLKRHKAEHKSGKKRKKKRKK
ncbi:MAG: hypothetical protein MPN21_16485 [Thermoanaerobaculia bacterium]|nr:hypothetical protein [Thermoanaerobaculia bacterium]